LFQTTTNQKLKHALAVANRGRKQIQPALAGTEDNA
jgi:hypothetical protein